jgi:hypothetical protein
MFALLEQRGGRRVVELLQAGVVAVFCLFVLFDVCSISPRIAGSITQRNGVAYSFQIVLNTLKRVFIVIYPPLLGFISILANFQTLVETIFISYYASLTSLAVVFLLRKQILAFFCALIVTFDEKENMLLATIIAFKRRRNWLEEAQQQLDNGNRRWPVDTPLMLMAVWVYLFYGSSMFMINILADRFTQYAEIIYQMVGFCNAIGTLALAFFLDPRLSRIYERRANLGVTYNSLVSAHFLNLMILGPALMGAITLAIWR